MSRIILAGSGIVSPLGTGRNDFWNCICLGVSGYPADGSPRAVRDFDFAKFEAGRRFRRVAEITRFLLAAVEMARDEAGPGFVFDEETALVAGLTHGALAYTCEFHRVLVAEGGGSVSPIHFSDSVLNAPAGNASICFGIKGPVHSVVGGKSASLRSLALASRLMRTGGSRRAVVASAEELSELTAYYYRHEAEGAPSEGAGALMLVKEDAVAGLNPLGIMSAATASYYPSRPREAANEAASRCLSGSGLSAGDIDLVLTDAPSLSSPDIGSWERASLMPLCGNPFPVGSMWHIVLACLIIENSAAPGSIMKNGSALTGDFRHILVCSTEKEGSAAAAVISRYE